MLVSSVSRRQMKKTNSSRQYSIRYGYLLTFERTANWVCHTHIPGTAKTATIVATKGDENTDDGRKWTR